MTLRRAVLLFLSLLIIGAVAAAFMVKSPVSAPEKDHQKDYQHARWDPLHFAPAISHASNEDCLACHKEVLDDKVREESIAGLKASNVKAWYQTLDTYEGKQETFHWRHLKSPYATSVMQMQCTTCHQGNNPRDRAVNPPDKNFTAFTLRKNVNPQVCLSCHGKFPQEVMGLPEPWPKLRDAMNNDCLSCHSTIRTTRHRVNFLKPEAIEELAKKEGGDVCFGCHGGRQWYRISSPYPRHDWSGMPSATPDWAKDRPKQSEQRFRIFPLTTAGNAP